MSRFDIDSLLSEVSGEAPCGEDISYDPAFMALEGLLRSGQGAPGLIEGGDEAEEPNWREVTEKSFELLGRSRDLRAAVYFTLGLLKTDGLGGLRDGLALVRGLLEKFWDHLYPRLDPDDNNDPLERINIISQLSPATVSAQDPMKFKQRVSEVALCSSARMGRFGLRDIQIARGEIAVAVEDGAKGPDMSVIDAAFQDTATDELLAEAEATGEAIRNVTGITNLFTEKAVDGQSPDLSGFAATLKSIQKCLQEYLVKRGHGVAAEDGAEAGAGGESAGGVSLAGDIRSPKEALLAIEKVCQYFDRHEPSSPVPLLLRRAQRLVSKNFLDVIADICPDAVGQVETLGGVGGDSGGGGSE